MTVFTIDGFWKTRLVAAHDASVRLAQGWSFEAQGLPTFKEAPLLQSDELGDGDPKSSSILLVSAPGAVGKSTLAREIAHAAGVVYIDLAKAEPVGGNTISGGLAKSGLYSAWVAQEVAILIDGLDEARLRVTQESFEAFLGDIAEIAEGRSVPVVLFGRTGAVQDAWVTLTDAAADVAVLEIGYYGPEAAVDFAEARLRAERTDSQHAPVERRALELLLERLRSQTENDGDRFAGYAPVLQAVADRVAQEGNASALIAQIERGDQPVTLNSVVSFILERERTKLRALPFEDANLYDELYSEGEQLDRLVARLFGLRAPEMPPMGPKDSKTYADALNTWVAEHPFLNGSNAASSTVFDAAISAWAMRYPASSEKAVRRELGRGAAANPFLSEFYMQQQIGVDKIYLPPEHIGAIYASLRARLSIGDSASLLVEGAEDGDDEESLTAEVEITIARRDAECPRIFYFNTEQTGSILLGSHIDDVDITAPYARVEVGPGAEAIFLAPVSIQCEKLKINADKLIAEAVPGQQASAIFLEAEEFDGARMMSVPVLRGDVSLAVSWPGVQGHPWNNFAREPSPVDDPRVEEALRRFRKFVIAFRSHSKGNLARYKHKLEHARMTKGAGQEVLDLMMADGILSLHGAMYYLDPDKLGEKTGATYTDTMARHFGPGVIEFVRKALGLPN